MELNLDSALASGRAARAEVNGEEKTFAVGGKMFTLPQELPWDISDRMADAMGPMPRVRPLMAALLNGQMAEFDSLGLTQPDLDILVDQLFPFLMGVSLPESSASSSSSADTSSPSRPTSPGSIPASVVEISEPPSGETNP